MVPGYDWTSVFALLQRRINGKRVVFGKAPLGRVFLGPRLSLDTVLFFHIFHRRGLAVERGAISRNETIETYLPSIIKSSANRKAL